jgi:hypothetical protein
VCVTHSAPKIFYRVTPAYSCPTESQLTGPLFSHVIAPLPELNMGGEGIPPIQIERPVSKRICMLHEYCGVFSF